MKRKNMERKVKARREVALAQRKKDLKAAVDKKAALRIENEIEVLEERIKTASTT